MASKVRKWYVDQALSSFKRLNEVLLDLRVEEVMACLDLEAATQRRRSVIDRLISRAIRLAEIDLQTSLRKKYHGTSILQNHVDR
jgi:hypothetical protein